MSCMVKDDLWGGMHENKEGGQCGHAQSWCPYLKYSLPTAGCYTCKEREQIEGQRFVDHMQALNKADIHIDLLAVSST